MKFLPIVILALSFFSCNSSSEIYIPELESINGNEILQSEMCVDRHVLEYSYDINTTLRIEYLNEILNLINNKKGLWKELYFNVMCQYCNQLQIENKDLFSAKLFEFFLHNPSFYLTTLDKQTYLVSDCLLEKLNHYISSEVISEEITYMSIKNVAYTYCESCTDQQINAIYMYLDLIKNYQE